MKEETMVAISEGGIQDSAVRAESDDLGLATTGHIIYFSKEDAYIIRDGSWEEAKKRICQIG